ncbi:hypothetical protein ES703_76475 [subsurface metagenome]
MSENKLRYTTDRKAIIELAREDGMSNYQIIVKLTQGRSYKETKSVATKWHEHLGITYGVFMKMARGRSW